MSIETRIESALVHSSDYQLSIDSGLWALTGVASECGLTADFRSIAKQRGYEHKNLTIDDIATIASAAGLRAHDFSVPIDQALTTIQRPAVILLKSGNYAVLGHRFGQKTEVFYHLVAESSFKTDEEIRREWSGEGLTFTYERPTSAKVPETPFGLRWFLPAVLEHRRTLAYVLLASVFVQFCGLAGPLVFQVVFDKVLVHSSLSTLGLVTVAFIVIGVFEAALQYLRTNALFYAASHVDMRLGSKIVKHLLALPYSYFERTAAGQIVTRVREIETIRKFLVGQALTSFIDIVFTVAFFAVIGSYSSTLMLIVAVSLATYVINALSFGPRIQKQSNETFNANAASQQFLTECVVGMRTLKAAAAEPAVQLEWDKKLAYYIKLAFYNSVLGNLPYVIGQLQQRLTTAAIIFFGANLVIAGQLTVGQLVAVNMLSGVMLFPVLRLCSYWQDFQRVKVSVDRLGDIVAATPDAVPGAPTTLSAVRGDITLRNVEFRYPDASKMAVQNINLHIAAGQIVGIIGPSGSGKSTLAKLLQKLYVPQRGQILIDGVDIALFEPSWIRKRIGVVLQDDVLFNMTIRDNIALSNPYMSLEQVREVALLAGADDFISKLPKGYDTQIVERGANLSGGQRQRIAIARALAGDPKILVFDEATSALDYESEYLIQQNIKEIARNRTVIIIGHRLTAVHICDRIIGISEGRIVEDGTPDELLQRRGGLYERSWAVQRALARSAQ